MSRSRARRPGACRTDLDAVAASCAAAGYAISWDENRPGFRRVRPVSRSAIAWIRAGRGEPVPRGESGRGSADGGKGGRDPVERVWLGVVPRRFASVLPGSGDGCRLPAVSGGSDGDLEDQRSRQRRGQEHTPSVVTGQGGGQVVERWRAEVYRSQADPPVEHTDLGSVRLRAGESGLRRLIHRVDHVGQSKGLTPVRFGAAY